MFHQTVTHQSLTEHISFTHSFSHSSVHSSSACHMLGPALCAGDLAARNKTDKRLSCSYGAYMAGDNKQVPAHVWRMCTTCPVEALFIQSPSVGIEWHWEGSSLLYRMYGMLQDLTSPDPALYCQWLPAPCLTLVIGTPPNTHS